MGIQALQEHSIAQRLAEPVKDVLIGVENAANGPAGSTPERGTV